MEMDSFPQSVKLCFKAVHPSVYSWESEVSSDAMIIQIKALFINKLNLSPCTFITVFSIITSVVIVVQIGEIQ